MRKQDNIKEMLKAPTINRYLDDTVRQAALKIRKEKIETDKKECMLYCLPKLKRYAAAPDATDEVLELLEGICDGSKKDMEVIHGMKVLFQHYEHFDAEDGEASKCKNMLQKIEVNYSKSSSHKLENMIHFRQGMEGFY